MPDNITRICELAAAFHDLAAYDLSVSINRLGAGYWGMCITAAEYRDPLLDSLQLCGSCGSQEELEQAVLKHLKTNLAKKRENMLVQLRWIDQVLLEDEVRYSSETPGAWSEAMTKSTLPLGEAGFSMRALKALEPLNLQTLGELCSLNEEDLVAVKFFGRKSLKEVKEVLAGRGLCLRPGKCRSVFDPPAVGSPKKEG